MKQFGLDTPTLLLLTALPNATIFFIHSLYQRDNLNALRQPVAFPSFGLRAFVLSFCFLLLLCVSVVNSSFPGLKTLTNCY
jgi:hypothetical protein